MPKLEALLKKKPNPKAKGPVKRKTGEQMLRIAKMWEAVGRR
jgi:hypothetical protein